MDNGMSIFGDIPLFQRIYGLKNLRKFSGGIFIILEERFLSEKDLIKLI